MNFYGAIELGRRALFASQLSLDVAGNNIANVNTPGYNRRRVELSETPPAFYGRLYLGTGVSAGHVVRVVDRLLEGQVRSDSGQVGHDQSHADGLSRIESVLGETGNSGISSALSAFYSSFSALATAADDPALRRAVATKADSLAASIRAAAKGLKDLRGSNDTRVRETLSKVTSLANDIASLNKQIETTEPSVGEAFAERDLRDSKLRELAGLVDINVAEGPRGTVNISFAGTGDALVSEATSYAPVLTQDASGYTRVNAVRGGVQVDITDRIRGGSLGGLLNVRDTAATGYQSDLDNLATDLISRVNALQTAGVDANGAAGGVFFTPTAVGSSAAATLTVSAAILADPNAIAAGTTNSPGDGSNALALALLETQGSSALGGRTSGEFLSDVQQRVGIDASTSSSNLETSNLSLSTSINRTAAIGGVNPDEEAVSIIQFQRSYEAAARFIAVINDLTKTALNLVSN